MSTLTITGVHPYATKFPLLPESELAELVESIRANGLRQPIVVTPDGLILDGRNRFAACEQAGVAPEAVVYDGDDLAEYVIDCNSARRHMSTGARAMATALVLDADKRRQNGRWKRGSIAITESGNSDGQWSQRLTEAGIILDHAPHLAEQVVNGDLALDAAHREACDTRDVERNKLAERERRAAEEADAKCTIEEQSPDYFARVPGQYPTYVVALFAWEQANREAAAKLRAERDAEKKKAAQEFVNALNWRGVRITGDLFRGDIA